MGRDGRVALPEPGAWRRHSDRDGSMTVAEVAAAKSQHWAMVMGMFMLASIAETLAFGHFGAFTPLYLREMGIQGTAVGRWTGILSSAAFMLGIPLAPFWGVWADKYSRKLIIVRSTYVEALIFCIAAFSQNPWQLLVGRLLAGFALGNTGVQLALQASITPRHRVGFAIAMISAAPALGITLGPALGGAVLPTGTFGCCLASTRCSPCCRAW